MNNDILIGREKECVQLSSLIAQKKNIIIFGPEGVGKSAIISKVLEDHPALKIFYSPHSRTLRESLLNFAVLSSHDKKGIREADTMTLKKLFYGTLLREKPDYIAFDHIERVGPKFQSFFSYLIEGGIPLILGTRGLEKKDAGCLHVSLFNFVGVEVSDFDKSATDILIEHFIKEFGIKITKEEDFKKEIFNASEGNPRIIKQLCFLARDVKYQNKGFVDTNLIDLDRKINDLSS